MAELKFLFKTFLLTLLFILVLQIKIGEKTIERSTYQVLANSRFVSFLNEVAYGAVVLGKQFRDKVDETLKK